MNNINNLNKYFRTKTPDSKGFAVFVVILVGALGLGCMTSGPAPYEPNEKRLAASVRDVGIDLLNQGRTAMAIRKLQEANARDPEDPITYLSLGEAYRRKGLLDKAKENLLISLELNQDSQDYNHQETRLNLSALYIQLGQYELARRECEKLVADPTFSTPWRALTNQGWADYKLGAFDRARVSFEEALEFYPRYAPAHLNLGMLDQREQHWLAAIRHYQQAAESNRMGPDAIAEANFHIAEIYVSMGERDQAISHFDLALQGSPYGQWGEQSQSYLELLR
ncbi:MAG: hypothetical protein CL917_00575 [Deltaproteobacteria bacterium]|nr:hypothetical protein [Deltaproteobacteria bacterium]